MLSIIIGCGAGVVLGGVAAPSLIISFALPIFVPAIMVSLSLNLVILPSSNNLIGGIVLAKVTNPSDTVKEFTDGLRYNRESTISARNMHETFQDIAMEKPIGESKASGEISSRIEVLERRPLSEPISFQKFYDIREAVLTSIPPDSLRTKIDKARQRIEGYLAPEPTESPPAIPSTDITAEGEEGARESKIESQLRETKGPL